MKLHYKPWKGRHYSSLGYQGLKLLVLGESHHQDYGRNAALRWTKAHIERPSRFWSTIEEIVVGRQLPAEEGRRSFWEGIAYTNVIQTTMHTSRDRPKASDLRKARQWFCEIVQEVKPEVVFLFSTSLWNWLPDETEFPGSGIVDGLVSPHPQPKPAYHYLDLGLRDQGFITGCFYHPSYFRRAGLPLAPWQGWAKRLLGYTRNIRSRR